MRRKDKYPTAQEKCNETDKIVSNNTPNFW